ncbi:MAG: M55 family metallopeptidase [Spirochaetes bacterium]|nr:M55 family metallopeptidase [Spirochaetota bacterium]
MKLLISVDMEGATGVVCMDHTDPQGPDYQRARHLLTADVNAAIEGALDTGIDDIQVSDGHWNSGNVLIEELHRKVRLNTGTSSPFSMVQKAQDGVDAVFFIGYHAMVGTLNAVLDHTWSMSRVANLWINGRLSGETGLNGSVCGAFGAPVLLVTGDQAVAAEAKEWIEGVETTVVKIAAGRVNAQCLPPEVTGPLIRETAARAVRKHLAGAGPKPLSPTCPVSIRLGLMNTQMADMASLYPGAKRLDGRTIEFEAPDMPSAYRGFRAAVNLASV